MEADTCPLGGSDADLSVDPGETIGLRVGLRNTRIDPAARMSAVLSSATPGVVIGQAPSTYPDIQPDGFQASTDLYRFTVDRSIACGATSISTWM